MYQGHVRERARGGPQADRLPCAVGSTPCLHHEDGLAHSSIQIHPA